MFIVHAVLIINENIFYFARFCNFTSNECISYGFTMRLLLRWNNKKPSIVPGLFEANDKYMII